ncbi:hypothetical protein ACI8AA_10875 [Geodermatophilus sp. SYSU D01180]
MSETPGERPRPTPRPRADRPRPSPRPRVAGSRRDREEPRAQAAPQVPVTEVPVTEVPVPEAAPAAETATGRRRARPGQVGGDAAAVSLAEAPAPAPDGTGSTGTAAEETPARHGSRRARAERPAHTRAAAGPAPRRRRRLPLVAVLAVLCVLAAGLVGVLAWQRLDPASVSPSVFAAAREDVQALYAYDYRDSEGSVQRKLDVLTGDLRDQYEQDLSQGGIVDTYEQVSATTRYEVLDVGLQQVSDDQDSATVVVFGQYVVESVNSGTQPAPEGSECTVTPEGAQSCTQTVQVQLARVDGDWKISDLTLLTTS